MNSLRVLMDRLIDYAGLFPPAQLPLPAAVKEYAGHRASDEAWMLARFICPVDRLGELATEARPYLTGAGDPWQVAALGKAAADEASFRRDVPQYVAQMVALRQRSRGALVADALEVPLPADVVGAADAARVQRLLVETMAEVGRQRGGATGKLRVHVEVPLRDAWRAEVGAAARGLALANRDLADSGAAGGLQPIGLKLRTGGVVAAAFPSVEQVAGVLSACRDAGVAFKATAGLHHPVRHFSSSVSATMHGFLNVFVGAVLAYAVALDEATLRDLLADEDAASFTFDDGAIGWRSHHAPLDAARAARDTFAQSFGSCSFDEPVADLNALGLLALTVPAPAHFHEGDCCG